MKRIANFCMLMSALILICSCSALDDLVEDNSKLVEIENVTMTARNFVLDRGTTRTNVDFSNQGVNFVWTSSDVVGVFPNQDEATQVKFPIADGEVEGGTATSSANFTGKGWAVMKANTYAAYYPFVPDMNLDKQSIPVSYSGQKQQGNGNTQHISEYDYMAASPTEPTANGNIGFDFKHLGCLFQFEIPVPKKGTYKTLTLKCEDVAFVTEGHVNITEETPHVIADACDNCFVIELDQVQTTREGEHLIINVLLPPVNMAGHQITVHLEGPNAEFETSFTPKNPFQAGTAYHPNLPAVEGGDVVKLMKGQDFNIAVKSFINNDTYQYGKADYKIKKVAFEVNDASEPTLPYIDVSAPESPAPIYAMWDASTGTLTLRTSVNKVYANEDATGMFYNLRGLVNFNQTGFSTNYATTLNSMFADCVSLQSIVLSEFDTEKVESIGGLFSGCTKLTSVNTSSFDTRNVTDMRNIFNMCEGMEEIDISHFDMSAVMDISGIFSGCRKLQNIKFNQNSINTSLSGLYYAFNGCGLLTSVDLRWMQSENLSDIRYAFQGCEKLETIKGELKITNKVWSLDRVFNGCRSLQSLDVSNWDVSNCGGEDGLSGTFWDCASLTALDVSKWKISSATHLGNLFAGCSSLESIDVSNWDTSNIRSFGDMFNGCSSLTTLDVTNFVTQNSTEFNSMFRGCSKLESLDLHNFDTRNAQNMGGMFWDCSSLTSLDISSFDVSHVRVMNWMFAGCTNLKEIVWGTFDTHYCEDFYGMFARSGFETLDLTHFNTESMQRMSDMFFDMPNLKTLDISSFNTEHVTAGMNQLFRFSSKLGTINLGPNFFITEKDGFNIEGMGREAEGEKTITCVPEIMNLWAEWLPDYTFINASTGEPMTPASSNSSKAKR